MVIIIHLSLQHTPLTHISLNRTMCIPRSFCMFSSSSFFYVVGDVVAVAVALFVNPPPQRGFSSCCAKTTMDMLLLQYNSSFIRGCALYILNSELSEIYRIYLMIPSINAINIRPPWLRISIYYLSTYIFYHAPDSFFSVLSRSLLLDAYTLHSDLAYLMRLLDRACQYWAALSYSINIYEIEVWYNIFRFFFHPVICI